jgi:hypothetical protein
MYKKFNQLGNFELGKGYAIVSLNPKLYPIENVKSACISMKKQAIFILDGDPDHEILVEIIHDQPEKILNKFAKYLL